MFLSFNGHTPKLGANVFIAPTAVLIGNVVVEDNASVWFNAVVRADMAPIVIGSMSNIQDNCTLHTDPGIALSIGSYVTIGHNAVVHGCTVEDHVLIGMHAVILNHARIGTGSIVAAGAVIREGQTIGPFSLAAGMPAAIKKQMDRNVVEVIDVSARHYCDLAASYNGIWLDARPQSSS